MGQLNNLDVIFLIIVGISALVGIARGMTKELLSILGWILAAAALFYIVPIIDPMTQQYVESKILSSVVSGLIVLICFCIVWILTVDRLSSVVRTSKLSAIDRVLGFAFGLARGVLIVVLVALMISSIIPEESKKGIFAESQYFGVASANAEPLKKMIPQSWIETFEAKSESLGFGKKAEEQKENQDDQKENPDDQKVESADETQNEVGKDSETSTEDEKKPTVSEKGGEIAENLKMLKKNGEELFNELAQPKPAANGEGDINGGKANSSDLDRLLDVLEDRVVIETKDASAEANEEVKEIKIKENVADPVKR